jgi:hypothetical protein
MGGDIDTIESRFREVTCLPNVDLSQPCIPKSIDSRQKTSKEETKILGYVPTPLWLVDEMLEPEIPNLSLTSTTCDACAGCGQFSIRLMRKLYDKFIKMGVIKEKVDCWIENVWLQKLHWFTEFQFSNVARLIYIFGPSINVYVGDSLNMKYAGDNDSGLLFFNAKEKKWVNLPNLMQYILPIKDDLNALLLVFDALEKKIGNCK